MKEHPRDDLTRLMLTIASLTMLLMILPIDSRTIGDNREKLRIKRQVGTNLSASTLTNGTQKATWKQYDSGWVGICGYEKPSKNPALSNRNASNSIEFREKFRSQTQVHPDVRAQRMKILSQQAILVRVSIYYDTSFAREHRDSQGYMEDTVRDLIHETQLIYEQIREFHILFVVVALQPYQGELPIENDASSLLGLFHRQQNLLGDLNILLVNRNMWRTVNGTDFSWQSKITGIAFRGNFCLVGATGVLVANTKGSSSALTLAHEISHVFNVDHDGEQGGVEQKCDSNSFIMSPSGGPRKNHWSPCSVQVMLDFFASNELFPCIFSPKAGLNPVPLSPKWDLRPDPRNPNRNILPGDIKPLDSQCQQHLDQAKSTLVSYGRNGDDQFTTCEYLFCTVDTIIELPIGPAATGSVCTARGSGRKGKCINFECV